MSPRWRKRLWLAAAAIAAGAVTQTLVAWVPLVIGPAGSARYGEWLRFHTLVDVPEWVGRPRRPIMGYSVSTQWGMSVISVKRSFWLERWHRLNPDAAAVAQGRAESSAFTMYTRFRDTRPWPVFDDAIRPLEVDDIFPARIDLPESLSVSDLDRLEWDGGQWLWITVGWPWRSMVATGKPIPFVVPEVWHWDLLPIPGRRPENVANGTMGQPIRPIWSRAAANAVVYATAWVVLGATLVAAPRWHRSHRRARRGACLGCGYNIAGVARCPECGREVWP